jgi:hypothetical protein
MREKGKGKKIPAPIKIDDLNPADSFGKRPSKFGAFLSRLSSPTHIGFGSSTSSSFIQPSILSSAPFPTIQPYPQAQMVPPPTSSPEASCASLIFTSDEEGEDGEGSSPTAYSPLTPLDFTFTFDFGEAGIAGGSPVRSSVRTAAAQDMMTAAIHEVSVFEDDEDEEQENFTADQGGDEDELMGVDPFVGIPRASIDSVARFSEPSNSKSELEREADVASIVSLDSGICCKPLPISRVPRRPPPVLPLPNLPIQSPSAPSLPSSVQPLPPPPPPPPPPSSSSLPNDWTLALPFLVDGPGTGLVNTEEDQQRKAERMRDLRRNDWTLGLDLTLSAGMLMGDERGDGRGRAGPTSSRLPSPLREEPNPKKRPGSPFPLLERSSGRPLSPGRAPAVSTDDDVGFDIQHQNDGAMERAFQALLADAGEGRLSPSQFGHQLLFLPIGNRWSFNDASWGSSCSSRSCSGIALTEHCRVSDEWAGHRNEETVERASVASTRTGPFYSARSSWQC